MQLKNLTQFLFSITLESKVNTNFKTMNKSIITLIGLGAIAIMLVLGYIAFFKLETAVPVQPTPSPTAPTATPISEPTSTSTPSPTATPSPISDSTSVPTSTPDDISEIDTSDWKTYRNEKYGFEMRYPKDWSKKENLDNTNNAVMFLNTTKEIVMGGLAPDDYFLSDYKINPKYTNDWIGIEIDTYPKPTDFNWTSWIKSKFSVVEKYENFNYKELKGIKVIELNGIFYGEPNIFLESEKLYNIRLFNDYPHNTERDSKRDDLSLSYFNQILSTFKFIN